MNRNIKKRLLFFIPLLMALFAGKNLAATGKSQAEIDSLLTVLPKAKEDTNKVKLLTELIYAHLNYKTEEGLRFVKPALELSEKLNWRIHNVKYMAGQLYWRLNKFDEALKYHFDALKIAS